MPRMLRFVLAAALCCCAQPAAAGSEPDLLSHPVYARYRFGREGKVADLGTQPLAVPAGVVGEVLLHDRILQKSLAARGWEFRNHAFLKGPDSNFFFQRGDLDFVVAGDWPTITLAATDEIMVVGLVKQSFSSLLAKKARRIEQLKGKRIGVALGTTAHYALLVALEGAGLKETDVTLVPEENALMVEALEQGRVDAFSCWEPTAANALRTHPELRVVQRFLNNSYLSVSRDFAQENPEVTELLVAAYIRALRWMRESDANLMQAVAWVLMAGEQLLGRPTGISPQDMARTTTNDLLKLAHSPGIPRQDLAKNGSIRRAFAFLQGQGKIPAGVTWARIAASFDRTLIDKVLADPKRYQLLQFDYEK